MNLPVMYNKREIFLARNIYLEGSILVLIFLVALGIRLFDITHIPLDYHPVKQYRSALTARAFYYSNLDNIEDWQKRTAIASLKNIGYLGPPVNELIAANIYAILGSEDLWIPKSLSVVYWTVGGIFLYAVARRMLNKDGALVTTAIYLLLPFGVRSSQSFQPDPLMIMFLIVSIYAIVLYHEHPTVKRLLSAVFMAAVAILIKPVCVFIIFGAFLGLQFHRSGFTLNTIKDKRLIIFSVLAVIPFLLYYGYGILNTDNLGQQAQKSFIPQLFLQPEFWDGWLKRIKISLGFPVFIGGLLGAFLFPKSWQKTMLFGMWGGYFLMCIAFNYTISTHDYYHLPLFPIVAISLGFAAQTLLTGLRHQAVHWYLDLGIWMLLAAALFLGAGTTIQAARRLPDYKPEVELYTEIGVLVSHSTGAIFLSDYDGKPLMYYGRLAGQYWPYGYDIRDEKLWGIDIQSPEERLKILSQTIEPEYFIVTDLIEYENQKELMLFLNETYPVLIENPNFIIYQLLPERQAAPRDQSGFVD
jgi:4-amino-4-deoxy-L-arabinose transferase-like glycosyltransferase